ncbi:MAG: TonB-dependent receptor [Colwellia sp.]|nr:TonB-dependent receptor [Colwellia sp.]
MKRINSHLVWTLILLNISICAESFAENEGELAELMSLLDEETTIATKSKMNADYVPGTVTVLHGDTLRRIGILTSGEALSLVPGFYMSLGNTGEVVSVVRGVGSSLNSSHLKIMLNGISVNSAVSGSGDAVLRLPVSQIDRIEIIRGPGSSLYGEFAFSGVVNIITQQGDNTVQITTGANNFRQADISIGTGNHSQNNRNDVSWNINASHWETDGTGRESGEDNFSPLGSGYAPGPIFDQDQGDFLALNMQYQGFEAKVHYIETERGSYFGRLGKNEFDYSPNIEEIFNVEFSKSWQLNENINSVLTLGYQSTTLDSAKTMVLPSGSRLPGRGPIVISETDQFDKFGSEESYTKANLQFNGMLMENHNFLLVLETVKFDVDDAYRFLFDDIDTLLLNKTSNEMINSERNFSSIVLQDQWLIHDDFELTAGVRYDHYSDIGSSTSPRIAGVWRITDEHILKTQYAEAFRPPTLVQSYFNRNNEIASLSQTLKPENIETFELSYTFRQSERKIVTTLFHSQFTDLIELLFIPGLLPMYHNIGEISANGIEFEWTEKLRDDWTISGSVSYVNTEENRDVDEELTGTVNWLANVTFQWQMTSNIHSSLLLKYVGEQEGAELPNLRLPHVETFSAFNTIDYSLAYNNAFGLRKMMIRLAVKNMTDEYWESQSFPTQWPEGLTQGERTWNITVEYGF